MNPVSNMLITREQLEEIKRMRQRILVRETCGGPLSARLPHAPIRLRPKPVGRDQPQSHDVKVKEAVRKTCEILPEGSPVHEQLRRTYDIDFPSSAMETVRQLGAIGIDLVFFSVQGLGSIPMLHAANRNAYPTSLDFEDTLFRLYGEKGGDNFYKPETLQWVEDENQLEEIFGLFNGHDKGFFLETVGLALRVGSCSSIMFIGHDRRGWSK